MELNRRKLFGFGAVLLAAPAIVRVASIMPISVPKKYGWFLPGEWETYERTTLHEAAVEMNFTTEPLRFTTVKRYSKFFVTYYDEYNVLKTEVIDFDTAYQLRRPQA
jgi:hypothetical protein